MVFRLEGRVDAWLDARGRVEVARPQRCPVCGHDRLIFDGWRPRHTRRGPVDIQRVRCAAAEGHAPGGHKSHSLVPDVLVAGRVDLASVIGWALAAKAGGAGHRRIAVRWGVPASTVRGWLRRAAARGAAVAGRLLATAAAADPSSRAPPGFEGLGAVGMVVVAARVAAQAYAGLSGEPVEVWRYAVAATDSRLLG
jgi:hypothetical protein